MKPIPQQVFVSPGQRGDCFRACIASILELPAEEVPHFVAIKHDWWGETQRWLALRGLFAMWIRLLPDELLFGWPCGDTYCILNGPSPRGDGSRKHSIVGKVDDGWNLKPEYDPHPDGTMLAGRPESAIFLLPLHPEHFPITP